MLPFMPMLIGAALGGGISALRGGNPLTGALLGAAGGALGGATGLLGSGATTAASTGAATAAGTGGGFVGGGYGSLGLAGQTALQGAAPAAGGSLFGNTMAGIGKDFSALQSFAQQNPVLARQGLGMASDLMQPPQMQAMPPNIMRGQQIPQQQAPMFAMGQPQISLI